LGLFRGGWSGKQLARSRDVGGTIAAGKQPVVPNAMKALWQHISTAGSDDLIPCSAGRRLKSAKARNRGGGWYDGSAAGYGDFATA